MHLALALPPSAMEDTEQLFDSLIETNFAQYFDIELKTDKKIASTDLHAPLGYPDLIALATLTYFHWLNISSWNQRASCSLLLLQA